MTIRVTAAEAKAKILSLLDDVAAGEEVEITKRGRTVARLVPANGPHALKDMFRGVAMTAADELVVADVTWYKLARLAQQERLQMTVPIGSWLGALAAQVRTVGISPAIAATAAALPSSYRGDAADRLVYATALETGLRLVTKDRRLRTRRGPRPVTLW